MTAQLRKILCIDDEKDILQIARLALEQVGGFEVHTCSGGKEAVAKLDDICPDLILLDAMMPQMDGPATLLELQKCRRGKGIPIIFMTARVQPAEIGEYKSLGAFGVISKPFDPMDLSREITSLRDDFHQARRMEIEALLAPLRKEYLAQMGKTLSEFAAFKILLQSRTPSGEPLDAFYRKVHHLSGTGSTYGFTHITKIARALEGALQKDPASSEIGSLLDELVSACENTLKNNK